MKSLLVILLILFSFHELKAQKYDLIVTSEGDSIACLIDSISGDYIYFKIKLRDMWFYTNTKLKDVVEYKYNVIIEELATFKPGTSYIIALKEPSEINQKQLNSKYYDLIITSSGDSIACNIDSISNKKIYFEMKLNDHWVHTNMDIIKCIDYKFNFINTNLVIFKPYSSYIAQILTYDKYFDKNIYSNRYLFAPSAYPMKKDLSSYSNITLGLHDFQYGFGDKFSIGFGTTAFFFPIYFMPSYSIPINDNSSFAIGDLFLFSPIDDISFLGNLLYGMYTKGSAKNNFTVGIGLWTTPNCEVAAKTISPAINFSAMLNTGDYSYFITENYFFQYNTNARVVTDGYNNEEEFIHNHYITGGISGFRVIGKNYPRNSWQFALAYVIIIAGNAPEKYKNDTWHIEAEYNSSWLLPWPIISYSRKF